MNGLKRMSMHVKLISAMIVTVVAFLLLAGYMITLQADRNTRSAGLDTARLLADQVVTLRTFYSEEVVKSAEAAGAAVNYDYAEHETTIPLPATMVKALGERISQSNPGAAVRLYSNYPFRHRGSVRLDTFQQHAIDAVEGDPKTAFHQMERAHGRWTMRYAVADVMRESCVQCHNSHPQSPKTNWQVGDVRGVVEVAVPVDALRRDFYRGSLLQGLLVLVGSCVLIGVTSVTAKHVLSTLHQTLTTVSGTSSEIAAAVDSNERIASEQSTALGETMTTMEQLGESSRLSAAQAATGANETSQALAFAEEGAKTVQETLVAMSELKRDVSRLSHEIAALSEQIDRIGEISTFVGDLANQTNLLAMNAAVEAAHAGQHGQGFAVVATEIRKLADQSTKSVSRIRDLVTDIQHATHASVRAAEESQTVVDQATTLAEQAARAFDRLETSVGKAAESVQQLALNNREQASGINQVVEAVDLLNTAARESVAGLAQTGRSLEALDQSVQQLRDFIGASDAD